MKSSLALFLLCITCLSHAQQPAAAPHTFTSTDGRKLTATIVEKTDTTVTLRRAEDGKDFLLPLERLSASDQTFVKAWGEKSAVEVATTSPGGLVKTWMLEPQWDGVGLFGDGLAPVKLGGKWGFINETGKMVIEPAWDEALSFADGLAPVQKDGKWGYIDKAGKVVVEPTWDDAEVFSGGVATIVKDGKFGFIDATGKIISAPKWIGAEKSSHGLMIGKTSAQTADGTWAVINQKGETLLEQAYGKQSFPPILISEHGICAVDYPRQDAQNKLNGKPRARFMNLGGKVLFEQPVAQEIEFHEGLAAVWANENQLAFIDPTGAFVIPPFTVARKQWFVPAHNETSQYRFSEGLAVVPRAAVPGEKGDQELFHGYMDKTGKMVIPARWAQAGAFSEGLALVSDIDPKSNEPGTWSIIDKTGTIVAPVQVKTKTSWWDSSRKIPSFHQGRVPFSAPGLFVSGYLDRTGQVVIPPVFQFVNAFQDGMALVERVSLRSTNDLADKTIIDTTGAVAVPLTRAQSNRLGWRWKGPESKGAPIPAAASPRRYGLVNKTGKVVVPPSWDDAEILSPDLVAYRVDGKFGLVNAAGQTVLPATTEKIEKVTPLSPNLIGFYVDGKFGLLNAKGEVVLPATIENIGLPQYHDEQSVRVRQGSQWGLLDIKTGKITPTERPNFANVKTTLPDDFARFEENKLWGVKAKDGTVLVAAQYTFMFQASKDRFWVKKAADGAYNNWGLMTQTGQMLTELDWDRSGAVVFSDGLGLVIKGRPDSKVAGGVSGYMDESGKLVIPLSVGRKSSFAHGAAMIWNAKESGLINTKGEWIFKSNAEAELSEIGFTSAFANHFQHGLALIETPLKWGFVKVTQAAK